MLDRARQSDYHVILCAHGEKPDVQRECLVVLSQQRVDGIVAAGTGENLDLWRETVSLDTRLVFVDRELEGLRATDVVLVDNVGGSHKITPWLIGLGYPRIGIVFGPPFRTTGASGGRAATMRSRKPAYG